jgi:hypothetical protein
MLTKPAHLSPVDGRWFGSRPCAAVALVLGLASFVVVAVAQPALWATPDPRLSVPGAALTALAATASIARRERAYPLWLAGLGLAVAALALGWFFLLAIVVGATAALIAVLHAVM